MDNKTILTLINQTTDSRILVQVAAIRKLEQVLDKSQSAVEAVVKRLKEDDFLGVRQTAIEVLSQMAKPTEQVRQILKWTAKNDEEASVRLAAENAIVKLTQSTGKAT